MKSSDRKSENINQDYLANNILNNINWNFSNPGNVGRSGLHFFDARKLHWYPATFIPEIPYTLIDVLSDKRAVIYDPFAGIGTTIFQALSLGRYPIATENSLIGVMIMTSIWKLLQFDEELDVIENKIGKICNEYSLENNYSEQITIQQKELLMPWFNSRTFNEISFLIQCEKTNKDEYIRNLIKISLSSTLKTVCAQQRGWGCISDNMLPTKEQKEEYKNAIYWFRNKIKMIIREVSNLKREMPQEGISFLKEADINSKIIKCDIVKGIPIPSNSVDLIITSPPYPNMTDYSFSQRLSYYWLESTPENDCKLEIGARRKRGSKKSLDNYLEGMKNTINNFFPLIKVNGYICLVLPDFGKGEKNNILRNEVMNKIENYLSDTGLSLDHKITRMLPIRRRHHNQFWTSLKREHIYIYRRA